MKHLAVSQSQKGFTLVELMVSLSLFIIVVLVLVGSLYTVNDASRKVQAMRTVMDNLSFAMESMSRTIRTSEQIVCPGVSAPNCSIDASIASNIKNREIFMNSTLGEAQQVHYRWNASAKTIEKMAIGLDSEGQPNGDIQDWQAITSPEIDVENMVFYVQGADRVSDTSQPSVIIQLDGVASVPNGTPIPFSIQTYLSQRTPE
jgi:type II secretory pathway pseudopilin PulG